MLMSDVSFCMDDARVSSGVSTPLRCLALSFKECSFEWLGLDVVRDGG
jgi:hypothetical protein